MIGNLLQALINIHQAGFIGAVALSIQRPRQIFFGLRATLFSFGALAGLFGLALFLRQGLLASRYFLSLASGLLFPHFTLDSQQAGMVGHGLQALFNVRQAGIQRPFLPGALRLLQKLFSLQFRL